MESGPGIPVLGDRAASGEKASCLEYAQKTLPAGGLRPRAVTPQEGPRPSAHPGTWVDTVLHPSTGTSSIEIPVLCLLVNGDPSTLEVGQVRQEGPRAGPPSQGRDHTSTDLVRCAPLRPPQRISRAVEHATPWLILAGSGGVADVLAALVNQPQLLVPQVAEKQFREKFPSEHFSWEDIVRWTGLV